MHDVPDEIEREPESRVPLSIVSELSDRDAAEVSEAEGELRFKNQKPAQLRDATRDSLPARLNRRNGDQGWSHAEDFKTRHSPLPDVYAIVANHQITLAEWDFSRWVFVIRTFAELFIKSFELQIALPPIRIESLNVRQDGFLQDGFDGYALQGALVFNEKRLRLLALHEVLALLLKLLLFAWQAKHGSPGRSTRCDSEFREKAAEFGLRIDPKGTIGFAPSGPFQDLLAACGVPIPGDAVFTRERPKGKSTNLLYTCKCGIKGRFGVKYVPWECRLCKTEVRQVEWPT